MPNSNRVSVIIVSYNDARYLKNCTESIRRALAEFDWWEIVIVNNDKRQKISSLALDIPRLKIVDHAQNVGFGAGVNIGAKVSQGEFLFVFNSDAEIDGENFFQALEEISGDGTVGILGAGIFDREGKRQLWSAGKEISFFDLVRNNMGLSRSKKIWSSKEKIFCDWVSGTAFLIKKDFFDQLGGFDERFFMYFEDMDLCHRAKRHGKKVLFYPEFKILHGNGQSYADKKLQKRHYYDSMEKYLKKHSKWPSLITFKAWRKLYLKN